MSSIFTQSLADSDDPRQFIELPTNDNDLVEFFPHDNCDVWFKIKIENNAVVSIQMFPSEEFVFQTIVEAQS